MTREEMEAIFHEDHDEYIKFDRVEKKRSNRPDLHAFLLLDELQPRSCDMVCSSHHDEFYLDTELNDEFIEKLTRDTVIELIRCGVRYSEDSFCMFS